MKKEGVTRNFQILVSITFAFLSGFASCQKENVPAASPPANNEMEVKINHYEKLTNEYVRVSKKLKDGDVSITVRYIELEDGTKQERAALQQELAKMTPRQAQRLASISAKAAP